MSKEYQEAMDELTMFVSIGGNEHDDAADGLTQLEMFLENPNSRLYCKYSYVLRIKY